MFLTRVREVDAIAQSSHRVVASFRVAVQDHARLGLGDFRIAECLSAPYSEMSGRAPSTGDGDLS